MGRRLQTKNRSRWTAMSLLMLFFRSCMNKQKGMQKNLIAALAFQTTRWNVTAAFRLRLAEYIQITTRKISEFKERVQKLEDQLQS